MNPRATADDGRESRGWTIAYWSCTVLGWGAYVAFGLSSAIRQAGPQPVIIGGYALFLVYSIALTHGLRRLIRRRQWLALPPARALARIGGSALIVAMIQTALVLLVQAIWTQTSPLAISSAFVAILWLTCTGATLVWATLYVGIAALLRARRARQDAITLELGMREARLKALEAQMSPHFLFNCLNSIRGMIDENPRHAQDMVTRLANILRHNLVRDTAPTESLGEQLDLVADYLALEAVRFDERLRTRFAIDPATRSCAAPATLLQTLVENAIKHGIAQLPGGGDVVIEARFDGGALVVAVENTGQLAAPSSHSTRVGLANLRERLHLLYGPQATFALAVATPGRVRAEVRISAKAAIAAALHSSRPSSSFPPVQPLA